MDLVHLGSLLAKHLRPELGNRQTLVQIILNRVALIKFMDSNGLFPQQVQFNEVMSTHKRDDFYGTYLTPLLRVIDCLASDGTKWAGIVSSLGTEYLRRGLRFPDCLILN